MGAEAEIETPSHAKGNAQKTKKKAQISQTTPGAEEGQMQSQLEEEQNRLCQMFQDCGGATSVEVAHRIVVDSEWSFYC